MLLAACAALPTVQPILADARRTSDIAATAFRDGRHDDAITGYHTALQLHRSIDNPEGIIRNLLNIAIVSDAAGNPANADACLDAIDRYTNTLAATTPADLEKPAVRTLLVDTAIFRIERALDAGQSMRATSELARLDNIPGNPPRESAGRAANARARVAESNRQYQAMRVHANTGISANRRNKDQPALADAHRLAGRAALALDDASAANMHFSQALALDRKLARPNCVAADLQGLARAATLAGDPHAAAQFTHRARTTSASKPWLPHKNKKPKPP